MHRLLIVLTLLLAASPAAAGDFFVAGGLGSSWATSDMGGVIDIPDPDFLISGSSQDEAPTYSGSVGFQWRTDHVVPWWDWVPRWPMRVEFEATGGRDYEFDTDSFFAGGVFPSSFDALTTMANFSLDLPIHPPIQMLFGRISFLEPARIYGTVGVGAANIEFATTDTFVSGDFDDWGFAWQAGAGLGYGVSRSVDLMVGYRHVDLGTADTKLRDSTGVDRGSFAMDVASDELVLQFRVKFLSIDWPGGRKL